ncbi:hypothetical protein Pint_17225 [Pistacia integerrima]|uniref:Uncharacterized protein n=1 Tax=Pistacia integerrima TaxID=434235 RepID=A0ACC0YTM5_9ROSI|nr:hypothetical protein Pint_17225 [Pistacia integerrima]
MAADEEAQQRATDRVTNLPGQPPGSFQHYSGYIQLQTQNEKAMFYWFFEAQTEPALKPLVIWLNGGPGCSSVAFGAAQEIGPFLMGNAVINDQTDTLGIVDYAWSHGIISDKLYQSLKADCEDFKLPHTSSRCNDQLKAFFDAFSGIDIFNIYSPVCVLNFSATTNSSNLEDIQSTFDPCVNNYVRKYFNQKEVQRALHANVTNLPYPYTLCSSQLTKWTDSPSTVLPTISKLLDAGMRIWTYSGDADARVPVTSTRYSVNKLGLPVMEEWRPWFYKRQVAGWVETYDKGLTLTTIRGGGHQAVLSARDWSLSLFTSFLQH